jgi:hypothetical protein
LLLKSNSAIVKNNTTKVTKVKILSLVIICNKNFIFTL